MATTIAKAPVSAPGRVMWREAAPEDAAAAPAADMEEVAEAEAELGMLDWIIS